MRTNEIKSTLSALDSLPMPNEPSVLRRVNAYAQFGITALNPPAYPLPKPRPPLLRRPAMAAALALALVGVGVGSVVGANLYTYRTASDFFADYGLSTEGLSRGDLWEVYRDITTGKFALPDTAFMLQSNLGLTPSGSASAVEAESLWEGWKENYSPTGGIPLDVSYHIQVNHRNHVNGNYGRTSLPYDTAFFTPDPNAEDAVRAIDSAAPEVVYDEPYTYTFEDDQIILQHKQGGAVVWSVALEKVAYFEYAYTDDYVVVAGETNGDSPDVRVMMISSAGEALWDVTLDNGETQELPEYILCGERSITLFSWTDRVHICRTVLDLNGNILENSVSTQEKGPIYTIRQVIPFREGHLLLMNNLDADTSLYYMNAEGVITDSYGFEDGGGLGIPYTGAAFGAYAFDLTVEQMLEANGYLYISLTGAGSSEGRKISDVLEWCRPYWEKAENGIGIIGSGQDANIPTDEFVSRVRACYRSFLLVCDPETMEVVSVTAMDGAYTTDHVMRIPSLRMDGDGNLIWTVESPYTTVFSPNTNSFTLAGSSFLYTFTLTPDGRVTGEPRVSWGYGYRM